MEILNTKQFNEKLNIQPVTADRLKKLVVPYPTASEMRANFQTGDIVVVGNEKENLHGTYISYKDVKSGVYDEITHFFPKLTSESEIVNCVDGVFVYWEQSFFTRSYVKDFNDELEYRGIDTHRVMYVYRVPFLKTPLTEDYLKTFPNPKAKQIWNYKEKHIDEKLDIQPVTKEMLAKAHNATLPPKRRLKFGDILLIDNGLEYVYIPFDELKRYITMFDLVSDLSFFKNEGIFIRMEYDASINRHVPKYTKAYRYNDNLDTKISGSSSLGKQFAVKQILRPKEKPDKIDANYVLDPPTEEAEIIWKRD